MSTGLRGLFLSHSATRTGAPMVLLTLLRWLKDHHDIELTVLCPNDGPLWKDFADVSRVVEYELTPSASGGVSSRVLRRARNEGLRRRIKRAGPFDFVYSNTLMNGRLLRRLPPAAPAVIHAHELGTWIATSACHDDVAFTIDRASHFIAPSEAVRSFLSELGVDATKTTVVREWIPDDVVAGAPRQVTRRSLGVESDDTFVVGGIGTTDWRKGSDLFVEVALAVSFLSDHPIKFVWIGPLDDVAAARLRHDISRAGLDQMVAFVGERSDARALCQAFDVLALPSREDPYPVVVLEAGLAGIPTVCFHKAGGAPEFVRDDAGVAVSYLSVSDMAKAIISLAADRDRLMAYARCARERARKHTIGALGPSVLAIIDTTVRGPHSEDRAHNSPNVH